MNIEKLKEFFNKPPEIIYPAEAIDLSKKTSVGKVFPISSKINEYIVPGLFIICNSEIFDFFKIGFPPPTPNIKFRMVNINQKFFAIEILLYLDDKIMRLHLNPINKLTKYYLKKGLKNNIIAFHFYNQENYELVDSITSLGDEEIEWFERNLRLAKKLKSNKDYNIVSRAINDELLDMQTEKLFKFHSTIKEGLLIEKSNRFLKMSDVRVHYTKNK